MGLSKLQGHKVPGNKSQKEQQILESHPNSYACDYNRVNKL